MNLPTRPLGQSDLQITPLGVGPAPIGSTESWRIYWGPQDERDAVRTIHAALDCGVNWIDTAPFYGWGRAETLVGRALQGRRGSALVFTKCGTLPSGSGGWRECLTPESIRQEVEQSLRRLQTDYVDLLQFHDPDPATPIEESWMEVQRLIQAGKVRYAGLSNHPIELIERAQALAPVTSNQHQLSMLHREAERTILPYSREHRIGFLAWSPLASGFLTDGFDLAALDPHDFRRRHPFAQPDAHARLARLRVALGQLAAERGRSLADLALAWALSRPGLTGAIVGVRSPREASALAGMADAWLASTDLAAIEQELADWEVGA
jgi:aryl-alcohol dehydrogenase-like predicted oxidoreductase